jgi:RNA polymerase sigma-70 factor (ECF subfamily)
MFDLERARAEIVRALERACPPWLASQAGDIAQDILARLVEKNRRGEGVEPRHPSYWRKAAHHALVDEIRRRRLLREESLGGGADVPRADSHPASDPERSATSRQLGGAIEECVLALSASRRMPVVLFLQGHTVPESAALLSWAAKRVGSGLHRGLRELRRCLAAKGWAP